MIPVKFVWGMVFCQGLIGSILVVGWTYRLTQRWIVKGWWIKARACLSEPSFAGFLASHESTGALQHWPNWFAHQNFRGAIRRAAGMSKRAYAVAVLQAPFHGLWLNGRAGLQAIFNTWLLTLPACLLWWFGWYDGWNNSFSKGYEQAAVGPLISIVGILWFIAIMFYLPLAQARQAATGEWRRFYDFTLIWKLARLRWLSCLGLALLYVLFALPLNVLKTFPVFAPQNHPHLAGLSDPEVLKHLNGHFFWSALLVLPAYVGLRLVAGRIYGSGLLLLLQRGEIDPERLGVFEQLVLARLGLLQAAAPRQRHLLVRFIAWTGTRLGRVFGAITLALVWFAFVAQVYVAEFFNFHGALGWLNQVLVQLPWFHYLPARLKSPLEEFFGAVFIFGVGWLFWRLVRNRKPRSSS